MECVPCGKKFTGEAPYQQHLASDKHKKKAFSYGLLYKQSDASSALNGKSITTDLHKTFHCMACDMSFTSPESYQWHSLTREHAEKVISGNLKNILNSDVVSSTDSKMSSCDESTDQKMDDKRNEDKSDMILDEFDENKNLKFLNPSCYAVCKECDKQFSGPESHKQHLESAKHLKMVELKKSTYQNVSFSCELCNKVFTGQVPYDQHIICEAHRKKVKQSKCHETNMSVTDSSSEMPVLKIEENILKIDDSDPCFCSICNVHCSGAVPYQQHLKGAAHLKNMNRAQQKNFFFPSANPLQPVTQLNNGECGISGIATNQLHLGENKTETDCIIPGLVEGIKIMPCDELEKSVKVFKPDESIDFDSYITETKMDVDAANGNVAHDSLEEADIELKKKQMSEIERNPIDSSDDKKVHDILESTETEAKGKQTDETERSRKVCDLCDVELFNADDVAKHYESVEHFNKRWRSN